MNFGAARGWGQALSDPVVVRPGGQRWPAAWRAHHSPSAARCVLGCFWRGRSTARAVLDRLTAPKHEVERGLTLAWLYAVPALRVSWTCHQHPFGWATLPLCQGIHVKMEISPARMAY